MMALMQRKAIYLFDVRLLAMFVCSLCSASCAFAF
jgi:hypothetical protein